MQKDECKIKIKTYVKFVKKPGLNSMFFMESNLTNPKKRHKPTPNLQFFNFYRQPLYMHK